MHKTNQIKGCFNWKYGSTSAVDSYLTLVHICLLKEENPKDFVCIERDEC